MSEEKGSTNAVQFLANLAAKQSGREIEHDDDFDEEIVDEENEDADYVDEVYTFDGSGVAHKVDEQVVEREDDKVEEVTVDNVTVQRIGSKDMPPVSSATRVKEAVAALSDVFFAIDPDYDLSEFDTFEQVMVANFIQKYHTMIKKQQGYGPENISKAGLRGIITRTQDKLERAKSLVGDPDTQLAKVKELLAEADDVETPEDVMALFDKIDKVVNPRSSLEDESLIDTLADLGNYGDIAVMLETGAWGKTLEHTN